MCTFNTDRKCYHIGLVLLVILIVSCDASKVLFPELHKKDTNWQMTESVHYFIYYRPGSPASDNIKEISKDLDSCFEDVLVQLQVNYRAKIYYYLYNSQEDLTSNTVTNFAGFAELEFQCMAQIYSSDSSELNAHETTHIIVYNTIGIVDLDFLEEGIAEAVAHVHDEESPGRLMLHEETHMMLVWNESYP